MQDDASSSDVRPGHDQPRRNLIMFMPDQLRYDSLRCTGNPVIHTPRFDELAKEGTLFTNCFTQATVCTQSRCSMFTGQYLHTSAHRSINDLLKPWEDNVFKVLKDAGYHVASIAPRGDLFGSGVTELCVSEYGFIDSPPNWPPKVSHSAPPDPSDITLQQRLFFEGLVAKNNPMDYDEAAVTSALKWLKSNPPQPFVLFLPLIYPHVPFKVKNPYYSMYREMKLPPRVKLDERTGYEARFKEIVRREHGLDRATEEDWHEVKAVYYGMISRLDDQFGEIIDVLHDPAHGQLWDNTYTMMYTDHGEYLGDNNLVEKWPSGVDETLCRDPLIIAGPELPKGLVNDSMCEMVDITPTILELLGVEERYPHSGVSLVKTIMKNKPDHKPFAFTEGGFLLREEPQMEHAPFPYDLKAGAQHKYPDAVGRTISVRDKEWTYVYRIYEKGELYHRASDPGERHNLIDKPEHASIVKNLRDVLLRWMTETSDYVPWKMDDRFPQVDLESPAKQLARRLKKPEQV